MGHAGQILSPDVSFSEAPEFFAAIFLALTADSMKRIPELTHADQLTESVVRREANLGGQQLRRLPPLGRGAYFMRQS